MPESPKINEMKVHQLITELLKCPAGCDVEIACGDMVAEPIREIQHQQDAAETVFLFAGDPVVMHPETCESICRLSELIVARTP